MASNIPRDEQGAPKAKMPSKSKKSMIEAFMKDRAKVDEARKAGEASRFYDSQSPAVRDRRKAVQADYEYTIKQYLEKDDVTQAELFNSQTFLEYTKIYLTCAASYIQGKIGTKPKAGSLWHRKDALCWWALRRIDDFTNIYLKWHSEVTSHIAFIADSEGFETSYMVKQNLTDQDLSLFFRALGPLSGSGGRGRANLKQHFIMWMMVWLTGVRPGSFTVSKGYEKGAQLGDGSILRKEDQTLRFSHCDFMRTDSGIAVQVTFHFLKGHRDPRSHNAKEAKKTWTFLPSSTDRLEFDMSLLLTGHAFSRGLFKDHTTIESLFNGNEKYLAVEPVVNNQALFVASDQAENLLPDSPMRSSASNDKLQSMCRFLGYVERNTMYSLRRTALIDIKRKHGTEAAKETAAHAPEGQTIYTYDIIGQSDIDITADRLDKAGLNRSAIRNMYSQFLNKRIDASTLDNPHVDLGEQLRSRADAKMQADEKYIETEQALREKMDEVAQLLNHPRIPLSAVNEYRKRLTASGEHDEELNELDDLCKKRKNLTRVLRRQYEKEVQSEMLAEHRRNVKLGEQGARPQGNIPKTLRGDARPEMRDIAANIESDIMGLITSTDPDDEESGDDEQETPEIDVNALEENDQGALEPEHWAGLPDHIEVAVDFGDNETTATDSTKIKFLKEWVAFSSSQITNLPCTMCALDDTVGEAFRAKVYNMSDLDQHLKSDFHGRYEQLLRAYNIDVDEKGGITCPLCKKRSTTTSGRFKKHMEETHAEQLEM